MNVPLKTENTILAVPLESLRLSINVVANVVKYYLKVEWSCTRALLKLPLKPRTRSALTGRLALDVKAVKHHHLVPRSDEVLDQLLVTTVLCVHLDGSA